MILSIQNCSKSKETLATFNGGSVQRWELDAYLSAVDTKNMPIKEQNELKEKIVQSIAYTKIAALEAEKQGLDKSNECKKRTLLIEEKAQLTSYEVYLRSKSPSLKFEMMEIQQLFLRKKNDESRKKEIDELLGKLNSGKMTETEIDNLVFEKSEESFYQALSGYEFPVCVNCFLNNKKDLTTPIHNAKTNNFITVEKEKVGYWITRKLSETNVDEKDLKNYILANYKKLRKIADKNISKIKDESVIKSLSEKLPPAETELTVLADAEAKKFIKIESNRNPIEPKVEAWKKKINFKIYKEIPMHGQITLKPEDVKDEMLIYSIGDKNFTYGDLNKKYPVSIYGITEQLRFINVLIQIEALKDDPEFIKIKNSDNYKTAFTANRDRALADCYFDAKHGNSEKINPKEMPKDNLADKYNLKINLDK